MIPTPPPPPRPRPDQANIPRPSISNTKKCKCVFFALLFAGTVWTLIGATLYLAFGGNGNHVKVSGSGGSTPGKVMNKLIHRIEKLQQIQPVIQYDALAVGNGAQKVAVDRKVYWFGSRASKGAELGGVNGQNPRQRVTSSNGYENNNNMFVNYTNGNHQQRPPLLVQQNGLNANGTKPIEVNNTSKTAT